MYVGVAAILIMWPRCGTQTFVSHEGCIWNLALIGPVVYEERMIEECEQWMDRGRTDRRTTEPAYTIKTYKPKGSGDLKKHPKFILNYHLIWSYDLNMERMKALPGAQVHSYPVDVTEHVPPFWHLLELAEQRSTSVWHPSPVYPRKTNKFAFIRSRLLTSFFLCLACW